MKRFLLPGLAARLLLVRGARWTVVAGAALAVLALLVDWVEYGAQAGGARAVTESLRMALLSLPGHLIRAAPAIAAVGAGIAVAGLVRSGEWLALGAAGASAWRRILPFAALGLVVGACASALDTWVVPGAGAARARAQAAAAGGPLRCGEVGWLTVGETVFRVRGEPGTGLIEEVRAFTLRDGYLADVSTARDLRWSGGAWRVTAAGPDLRGELVPEAAPWAALPEPGILGEALAAVPPSERTWAALSRDGGAAARAERGARWSRAVGCAPAALVGAAVPALLGAGSLSVLVGVLPVLVWEALAAAAQIQATGGALPAGAVPFMRLALAALACAAVLLRLRRP